MAGTRIVTSVDRGKCCVVVGFFVVLAWSGVCAGEVFNPSFESTYPGMPFPRQLPQSWYHTDHSSFNSYCTNLWSTDGTQSAALFNRIGRSVSSGNCQSFYQFVDLTGVSGIEFDARLVALPAGTFEHFEAEFLIDGVPLWRQDASGVYPDQQVNVPRMAGWHRVEIRNTAFDSGTFAAAYWAQWDNLRLVTAPAPIPAVIALNPGTLNPSSNGKWITCYIELGEGHNVGTIDGSTVKLAEIPAAVSEHGGTTALSTEGNVADYDSDGVLERMVKFDRAAVQAIVQPPQATLTVTGGLTDGTLFEGSATILVLDKESKKK
jgi:hypothetical protein